MTGSGNQASPEHSDGTRRSAAPDSPSPSPSSAALSVEQAFQQYDDAVIDVMCLAVPQERAKAEAERAKAYDAAQAKVRRAQQAIIAAVHSDHQEQREKLQATIDRLSGLLEQARASLCKVNPIVSRVCQLGTATCTVDHSGEKLEQARASQEQHGAEWRLVRAGDVAPLDGGHGSWVETTHPAVIACMGSAPPCIEGGCQLSRQYAELEQARAEIAQQLKRYRARHDHDCASRECDICGEIGEPVMGWCPSDNGHKFAQNPCTCGLDATGRSAAQDSPSPSPSSAALSVEQAKEAALMKICRGGVIDWAGHNFRFDLARETLDALILAAQSDRDKQWLTALRHITSRVDTERILERMGYTEQEITDAIR